MVVRRSTDTKTDSWFQSRALQTACWQNDDSCSRAEYSDHTCSCNYVHTLGYSSKISDCIRLLCFHVVGTLVAHGGLCTVCMAVHTTIACLYPPLKVLSPIFDPAV
eukprot:GHVR01040229.1.p1 GENE.GHVR01040229.1~~GHVR01040229.1.p1  ORF type:complete len:106 (+),score=2.81 GHVR01040229.1:86-403(+)